MLNHGGNTTSDSNAFVGTDDGAHEPNLARNPTHIHTWQHNPDHLKPEQIPPNDHAMKRVRLNVTQNMQWLDSSHALPSAIQNGVPRKYLKELIE